MTVVGSQGCMVNAIRRTRPTPVLVRFWPGTAVQARRFTAPVIAGTTEDEIASAKSYCAGLVQRFDTPSHVLQFAIPAQARDAYLSLRAFNIDIARIADTTSNMHIGAMRMQFWREAVTKALAFSPPKEPVAVLLSYAAAKLYTQTEGQSTLSKVWLHRVISMREAHLKNPPFPNVAALEDYAEQTYSTLLYLTLSALNINAVASDHIASHIGKAQGIVAMLRGLPLLAVPQPPNHHSNQAQFTGALGSARQGVVTLPLDVMAETGVREEQVLRQGAQAPGLRDAIFAVATRANDHLITSREMLKNLRSGRDVGHDFEHEQDSQRRRQRQKPLAEQNSDVERGFGVYMPAVSTQMWLDQLQKVDFDVFHPSLRKSDWKLPLKAYWAFSRRTL